MDSTPIGKAKLFLESLKSSLLTSHDEWLRLAYSHHYFRHFVCELRYILHTAGTSVIRRVPSKHDIVMGEKGGICGADYNLTGIYQNFSSARSERLIGIVQIIETLQSFHGVNYLTDLHGLHNKKALLVGSRGEGEIFLLHSKGYKMENIKSVDLNSYSPLIDCGDMHELPYGNNSFDLVFLSHTLAYSTNKHQVASELLRVTTSFGIIAIADTYYPEDESTSAQNIRNLFPSRLEEIFCWQDNIALANQKSVTTYCVLRNIPCSDDLDTNSKCYEEF